MYENNMIETKNERMNWPYIITHVEVVAEYIPTKSRAKCWVPWE